MRTKEEYLDEIEDNLIEIEAPIEIIQSHIGDIRRLKQRLKEL